MTVQHPVERGEVLKEADLTIVRRPKTESAAITDMRASSGSRHGVRCARINRCTWPT